MTFILPLHLLTSFRCWSNYLGRQPQLQLAHINTKKFEVFANEDSEMWSPYTNVGLVPTNAQPARTRAVALQISKLAEISSDLLVSFYQPSLLEKPMTKLSELKKLTDIHTRLEAWKQELPVEFETKEGQLPSVLLMHMFYQLLYIHLYRPFLRFTKATSPLPAHVSPRKFCTQAAGSISRLLRLYKRTHGLRQIINKVVYIAHSACTIHLLNLPDKNARRDIVHGIKQLEEIGECWTAARRTIRILALCAERWHIELPEEAEASFARARARWPSVDSSPGPISPDTLANMTQQITAQPVPDLMAQNMLLRNSFASQNSAAHRFPPVIMAGLSAPTVPSPIDVPDTRRSSDNYSMPPHSAADLTRNMGDIKQTTHLTTEQQEAWNVMQARMSATTRPLAQNTITTTNETTQNLFGGVESLIGESQDWWYNDQNQLAQGFDNWTAPEADWSSMNGFGLPNDINVAGSAGLFPHSNGVAGNIYDASRAHGHSRQQHSVTSLDGFNHNYQELEAQIQHHQQQTGLGQAQSMKRQVDWGGGPYS